MPTHNPALTYFTRFTLVPVALATLIVASATPTFATLGSPQLHTVGNQPAATLLVDLDGDTDL